jgi:hypothetical protein
VEVPSTSATELDTLAAPFGRPSTSDTTSGPIKTNGTRSKALKNQTAFGPWFVCRAGVMYASACCVLIHRLRAPGLHTLAERPPNQTSWLAVTFKIGWE